MPKRLDFNKQTLSTIFMEEYLKQLELAQEGDQKAISYLLSELEEGEALLDNPLLKLKLQIHLSELLFFRRRARVEFSPVGDGG